MLKGYMVPRSPLGQASIDPPPPWHYSGDVLAVEFWADPATTTSMLPDGLSPDPSTNGHAFVMFEPGPLLVARIRFFGFDPSQEGLCHGEMLRHSRDRCLAIEKAIRPLPFARSTRHFAPARHLASGLSWKQHSPMRVSALAMVRRDRRAAVWSPHRSPPCRWARRSCAGPYGTTIANAP